MTNNNYYKSLNFMDKYKILYCLKSNSIEVSLCRPASQSFNFKPNLFVFHVLCDSFDCFYKGDSTGECSQIRQRRLSK